MNKKFKAYTLAEIIITMIVIGVIMSMTLPSYIKNSKKLEWIATYKTAFSIINEATMLVMAENGGSLINAWSDTGVMYTKYQPYLKIAKTCSGAPGGNCFATSYAYMNTGTTTCPAQRSVILTNGMSLGFQAWQGTTTLGNINYIYVDTNGLKGPNIIGKDYFQIEVSVADNPVMPNGWRTTVGNINYRCPDALVGTLVNQGGDTCGCRILRGDYGTAY